jgi:hypothetical protein
MPTMAQEAAVPAAEPFSVAHFSLHREAGSQLSKKAMNKNDNIEVKLTIPDKGRIADL